MVFPSIRCLTCKIRRVKVGSFLEPPRRHESKLTMPSVMHRDRGVTAAAKGIGIVSGRITMLQQPTFPSRTKMHLQGAGLGAHGNGLTLNYNPESFRHTRSQHL